MLFRSPVSAPVNIQLKNESHECEMIKRALQEAGNNKTRALLPNTGAPAFIELPVPRRKSSEAVTLLTNPGHNTAAPVACIRNADGLSVEIFSDIAPEMVRCLVEALGHAE